jgi:hypothetical protein
LLLRAPAPPLSTVLGPLTLDRLTVADDTGWLDTVEHESQPARVHYGRSARDVTQLSLDLNDSRGARRSVDPA